MMRNVLLEIRMRLRIDSGPDLMARIEQIVDNALAAAEPRTEPCKTCGGTRIWCDTPQMPANGDPCEPEPCPDVNKLTPPRRDGSAACRVLELARAGYPRGGGWR